MRLKTQAEAEALGIEVGTDGRARIRRDKAKSTPDPDQQVTLRSKPKRRQRTDPQEMIYRGLCSRLPGEDIRWEKMNLIPGRKSRADIFLPHSRLSVEMDGFQYHRSKSAFQSDRERQNLFAEEEIAVLRYYAAQVHGDLEAVIDQIERVHWRRVRLFGMLCPIDSRYREMIDQSLIRDEHDPQKASRS